jgi:hypothetical protein
MRATLWPAPLLLALGLSLAGCHKSGAPDHDTFTDTKPNQVVLNVDGLT